MKCEEVKRGVSISAEDEIEHVAFSLCEHHARILSEAFQRFLRRLPTENVKGANISEQI